MYTEAEKLIKQLGLEPHPEGGFYKETYRSKGIIPSLHLPSLYQGECPYSTAILFLLSGKEVSKFHRMVSDEIWHYYKGSPVVLYTLDSNNGLTKTVLGSSIETGQQVQVFIQSQTWMAAQLLDTSMYGLIGCTAAPGFMFADFELADQASLIREFPEHAPLILQLT